MFDDLRMFDYLQGLFGNPMLKNLQTGPQGAGPAASFGGLGGPQMGNMFQDWGGGDPFAAGQMPNLVEPQQAVTYPPFVTPTIDPRTPGIFPGMPDVDVAAGGLDPMAIAQMASRLGGFPAGGGRQQPQMPPAPGGGIRSMNPMPLPQWMQGAQLRRR